MHVPLKRAEGTILTERAEHTYAKNRGAISAEEGQYPLADMSGGTDSAGGWGGKGGRGTKSAQTPDR